MDANDDRELLTAAIESEHANEGAIAAFEDMLKKLESGKLQRLSDKQRAWASAVCIGEKYEPPEEYRNDFSAGRVPLGRPVATAPVLLNLPKAPPGRK